MAFRMVNYKNEHSFRIHKEEKAKNLKGSTAVAKVQFHFHEEKTDPEGTEFLALFSPEDRCNPRDKGFREKGKHWKQQKAGEEARQVLSP